MTPANELPGHAWLAGVVAQIPVALVIAEALSGRIVLANDEAERLTRRQIRTLDGADAPALSGLHPYGEALKPDEWPLARALHGETVEGQVIELLHDDGTHTLVEVSARPIRDDDENVVAAVMVLRDIVERERRETAEREFIANAAHQLQTPVAAIANAVEALQSGAKDDPERRDRFLAHLERDVGRLERLSSALLALARFEGRGESPPLELLPLEPLLTEAAASALPASGVEVRVDCPADVGVLTHRDLFAQVLDNLCSNATRHTEHGHVSLSAQLAGRAQVEVHVEDTGGGIASDKQKHIFRRFYRGDANHGSSGLGLAIVQQAVDALGGQLELESTAGVGTSVSVTLPGARLVR